MFNLNLSSYKIFYLVWFISFSFWGQRAQVQRLQLLKWFFVHQKINYTCTQFNPCLPNCSAICGLWTTIECKEFNFACLFQISVGLYFCATVSAIWACAWPGHIWAAAVQTCPRFFLPTADTVNELFACVLFDAFFDTYTNLFYPVIDVKLESDWFPSQEINYSEYMMDNSNDICYIWDFRTERTRWLLTVSFLCTCCQMFSKQNSLLLFSSFSVSSWLYNQTWPQRWPFALALLTPTIQLADVFNIVLQTP